MAKSFLALAAAALALGALPSRADVVVTWTGTVFDGNDPADYFGVGPNANPLGNLQGQAFTARFQIDPTVGSVISTPDFLDVRGGTFTGAFPSPVISATLTINGVTFSFGSNYFGGYQRDATPGRSGIYTEVNQQPTPSSPFDILVLSEFIPDNSIPYGGIGESLTHTIAGGGFGSFQAFSPGTSTLLFQGHFTRTLVTIGPSSNGGGPEVPEPATGVLTLAAAGAALLLRRRGQRPI
ncbi:MAG: PEP-CTERM sorting domain-containing protein [Bryobacterales bacterium]|nr:PEP-CTERM sorting domain-containing protein [Bryobacterales bacterium]